MQFARKQYRGRPTKWHFLNQFFTIRRETWPVLRDRQRTLLVGGRISVQAFKFEYNLECCSGWKWIQSRIEKAYQKKDPLAAINQINIYRLEQCVEEVKAFLEKIEAFTSTQESLPLAETEGYAYNQQWDISPEELEAILAEDC